MTGEVATTTTGFTEAQLMEKEAIAILAPFAGRRTETCPKCGQSEWYKPSFHRSRNGSPWSCYSEAAERIDGDHLHYECENCGWQFATLTMDAVSDGPPMAGVMIRRG